MVPEPSRLSHSNLDVTSRKPSSTAKTHHLSPLPAFDIPSFDLPDFDFDTNFSIPASDRTASTDAKHTSLPAPEPDKMGRARGKSLLTRRQSWMPGSKSASDLDLSKVPENEPSRASQSPPRGSPCRTEGGGGQVEIGFRIIRFSGQTLNQLDCHLSIPFSFSKEGGQGLHLSQASRDVPRPIPQQ
ncbi:hypothetical protein PG990_006041 [Apiospora arundinis]